MTMKSHKVIRTQSRFDARPGQAPAARIVPEVAKDALPGHGIAEIPVPEPVWTIAAASMPGAKRFRPAR
ncbi:MAG: hypothetical protein OXF56_17950 [Rhodobacteraceae bacterium]|nr:hypothetical protein [Paracoccaceae bacterium]